MNSLIEMQLMIFFVSLYIVYTYLTVAMMLNFILGLYHTLTSGGGTIENFSGRQSYALIPLLFISKSQVHSCVIVPGIFRHQMLDVLR